MDKDDIKNKLQEFGDIQAFTETAAGLKFIKDAKEIIIFTTQEITSGYKTKSHVELMALCAKLSAYLDIYSLMTGITDQVKELEEIYKTQAP